MTLKAHGFSDLNTTEKRKEKKMENLEVLQNPENVEPTTEQEEVQVEQIADESAKVYTEEEFNKRLQQAVDKKMSRREAKIRKEYERKYGQLETVLRAGTGVETVEEMTNTFTDFYKKKGVEIPQEPKYSQRDIEVLANAEADEIINVGLDEVIEEVDRLAEIGLANMTSKEKVMFKKLAEYRQSTEHSRALEKIGVTKDVYTSQEFQDFAKKFSSRTPIEEVFNIYKQTQPKKQIQTMGSMKSNTLKETGVKEHYTVEEARMFTKKDYDNNPELYKAVERSMLKWKR